MFMVYSLRSSWENNNENDVNMMTTERPLASDPNRVQIANCHISSYRPQIHVPEKWNQTSPEGLLGAPRNPKHLPRTLVILRDLPRTPKEPPKVIWVTSKPPETRGPYVLSRAPSGPSRLPRVYMCIYIYDVYIFMCIYIRTCLSYICEWDLGVSPTLWRPWFGSMFKSHQNRSSVSPLMLLKFFGPSTSIDFGSSKSIDLYWFSYDLDKFLWNMIFVSNIFVENI